MTRSAGPLLAVAVVAISLTLGCAEQTTPARLTPDQSEFRRLKDRNEALQNQIADLTEQVVTLQSFGDRRLSRLYQVQRIELGRHTGGIDLDDQPGDDAIKVYLKPIDQHGSVIKSAGQVRIRLFDLAADPPDNLVGEHQWSVEQVGKHWHGGFGAYHFSFECPLTGNPPAGREITVRLQFTDYLTGKSFSAQKLCKLAIPAS